MNIHEKIKDLIATNNLEDAIKLAFEYLDSKEKLYLDITLIARQFTEWKANDILNLGNKNEAISKIAKAIYELAEGIRENEEKSLSTEKENYTSLDKKSKQEFKKTTSEFLQYYRVNNQEEVSSRKKWLYTCLILFTALLFIFFMKNNNLLNHEQKEKQLILDYYNFINKGVEDSNYYKEAFNLFTTERKNKYIKIFSDLRFPNDFGNLYPKKDMYHEVISLGKDESQGKLKCYYLVLKLRNELIPVNPIYYMISHRNNQRTTLYFKDFPDSTFIYNKAIGAIKKSYYLESTDEKYNTLGKSELIKKMKDYMREKEIRKLADTRLIENIGNEFSLKPLRAGHEYRDMIEIFKVYIEYEDGKPKISKLPRIASQVISN